METYICIDIGGTNIRAALFPKGEIKPLLQERITTQGENQTAEERLVEIIKRIWPQKDTVQAMVVAAPGYIDTQKGVILKAVNIPDWVDLPLKKNLENIFNTQVFLGNDARLAALGEWRYGSARGHHDVLYLTISTGIGGGVIIKDQMLMGSQGIATELGHVVINSNGEMCSCGHKGHLEALASGKSIVEYVRTRIAAGESSSLVEKNIISAKEIFQAAKTGDQLAIDAFKRAGRFLGIGVANYLHIFNPSCVVLGGGVIQSGDLIMKPFRASLEEHILDNEYLKKLAITTAQLGDNAGLIGGLVLIELMME